MGERSMSMFRRFVKDDSGATAIEYGLIAALVSVAIIAALTTLGDNLSATFDSVSEQLSGAGGGGGGGTGG
jgi:pilus assembly protein Flp/PilA